MAQSYSQKPLYSLFGKIVHGRGIGKLVGAPTANLQILSQDSLPPIGVYIAEITLEGRVYHGVTNIGTRPTVDNDTERKWVFTCSKNFAIRKNFAIFLCC